MGYYTRFSLLVKDSEGNEIDPKNIIRQLHKDCYSAKCAIGLYGETEDEIKWYDYKEDMKEFSLKYPEYTFTIDCECEDDGSWRVYFKNGKSQIANAIITYEDCTL